MGRLIDTEDAINQVAMIAKALAESDKQKALCGRIIYMLEHRPPVKAIPLEKVEQIRSEIEQEYNKFRSMSDKWDERACGLGTALEIIDKAIKEQTNDRDN